MLNTCSIGRRWKPREGWSRPVLTGERGTLFPIPLSGDRVSSCGGFFRWMARSIVSCGHDDDTGEAFGCSRPLSGSRTATIGIGRVAWFRFCRPARRGWPLYWFCGGHGPGETPGPFPNPEAKAWHGDGTALERVWESSTPPHSTSGFPSSVTLREPPFLFVFRFPGDPRARRSGNPFLVSARVFSSAHWRFLDAGRPVGGRIVPVTGSFGTLGDPRNFRGASCPYPMVE